MGVVVKWSVVLALAVFVLGVLIAVTGLHTNPLAGGAASIGVAILINIVVVFLALKQTSGENPYGKQLLNGALIGVIGGILIFLSSWLLLAVVFPDYLDEMRAGYTEWIEASGLPEAQMQKQLEAMENATPVSQSVPGLIGTFFTSLIVGAIVAIFQRKK